MTERQIVINKIHLTLTSLDKLLFSDDGITKADVIDYYLSVSKLFLKYVKNRPLTLQRFPKGIQFPGFIQKHADFIPDWIKRIELPTKTEPMLYVVASKKSDLGYLVNLNTIAFHGALSTIDKIDYPDVVIWDLDPSNNDFEKVIEVSFKLKTFLDEHNVRSLIKTTGSKGLHIYAPLNGGLSFDEAHEFSKLVADNLEQKYPKIITTAQQKLKRGRKVLIDYVRNSYGQTAVSAYSLRALPKASIATPIEWNELGKTVLSSQQFNFHNIQNRIAKKGDLWAKERINNSHLAALFKELNKRSVK